MEGGQSLLVETEAVNEDQLESHPVHNPVIGSLVTSYGRDLLYRALQQCGRRALYCDTVQSFVHCFPLPRQQRRAFQDSIIYVSEPGERDSEPWIDPDGLLGSWVNEVDDAHFIAVNESAINSYGLFK